MDRSRIQVSPDQTHHIYEKRPFYEERFTRVLRYSGNKLAAVFDSSGAYHIDLKGNAVYPARFLQTFGFYGGHATVRDETGWFHIKADGIPAYTQRYAWCGNFQEGLCVVRNETGEYHHILPIGEPAYSDRYVYAGDFREGSCVVQIEGGKCTHILPDGSLLHGKWFDDLDVYHKAFARAKDEKGWSHIDAQGNSLYEPRYQMIEPFYNGQARVEDRSWNRLIIDEHGATVCYLRRGSHFQRLSADLDGFWKTHAIACAVKIGIFEHLPGSTNHIADSCSLATENSRRLLRALAEIGLLKCDGDIWKPTPEGSYLSASHPETLADAATEYSERMTEPWRNLHVTLNTCVYDEKPNFFESMFCDQKRAPAHHRMLRSYAEHDYSLLVDLLPLKGVNAVVDAGGGTGTLASMIAKRNPNLHVTLLDLPQVLEIVDFSVSELDNLSLLPGDIFQPWNCQADAVILARGDS
ncbi:MAG: WG repeat-containing protein [Planctomycetota bacterium]|nr:WG repeat-containing protein [Planctomycetota bacterium]